MRVSRSQFSAWTDPRVAETGDRASDMSSHKRGIDLYWLPLGAGGRSVRWNGRIFERVAAALDRRDRCDLYHSALEVGVPEATFVIEQAPAWSDSAERGVVAEGAVGAQALGRFRLFRYEIRLWRDGLIPDIAEAVDSPQRLSDDTDCAQALLELVPLVPTPVWGRDELRAGEMWNSNSLISWLIARCGLDVASIQPPAGGRAPGWQAGIAVARRQQAQADQPRVAASVSTARGASR
jgi:hypothetical protein